MPPVRRLAWVLVALLVGAAALLSAGPSSLVDWRAMRAIAIESDDWGLCGFVPSVTAWEGLRHEDLSPGRFPAVYWNSTLEDSAAVASLAAVLQAHRGRDGLPAVLQPNYIVSSQAYEDGVWRRHDLPDLPRAYARPGMWRAVGDAARAGVWHPEFHGAWHYDPRLQRQAIADAPQLAAAAARGIMLFPGSEAARELGPWRSTPQLAAELDTALAVFGRAFGRAPGSIIAPDYTWDGRVEALWQSRELAVIQAKREQRHPDYPSGLAGRVLKVLERQWARAAHPRRTYLERNCRLEPVQSPDPREVVAACVRDTERAWRRGEPAIVESHRVNFAHADRSVEEAGRDGLAGYLAGATSLPSGPPVFLVDAEVAALAGRGTSLRAGPGAWVARNGTHARRVAWLPPAEDGVGRMATLLLLDSGCARRLDVHDAR